MRDSLCKVCRALLPLLVLLAGGLLMVSLPDRVPDAAADGSGTIAGKRLPWNVKGGILRVGSPGPVRQATVISPYGPGFEFELVSGFCEKTSCTPEWVSVPDKETGFAMLERGEIDVLVGFWGEGPEVAAGGADTPAERTPPVIAGGKAYAHFNPVRVTGPVVPRPADDASRAEETENPGGLSAMGALTRMVADLLPSFVGRDADSSVTEGSGEGPPFPVFTLVMDGNGDKDDIVLIDPASSALWLPFMGEVTAKQVKRPIPYRWFWKNDRSTLAARLKEFWADPKRKAELEELTERYFGFLPTTLRQRDVRELADTLVERLPEYAPYILKASRETGVPSLLLVAAIYQESRFDPGAVSETRVRGIMQLTTATAHMLNVDRKDPEQCILGGARYLRDLFDRIGDKAADEWDRWFMALAAYNQGMSNLNRTIRIAKDMGRKGDTWADIKTAFPLNTTCRGVEAKSFVERIRYYNFILHGLVALAPAETQDFAPLLGLAVADSAR